MGKSPDSTGRSDSELDELVESAVLPQIPAAGDSTDDSDSSVAIELDATNLDPSAEDTSKACGDTGLGLGGGVSPLEVEPATETPDIVARVVRSLVESVPNVSFEEVKSSNFKEVAYKVWCLMKLNDPDVVNMMAGSITIECLRVRVRRAWGRLVRQHGKVL